MQVPGLELWEGHRGEKEAVPTFWGIQTPGEDKVSIHEENFMLACGSYYQSCMDQMWLRIWEEVRVC